MPQSVSAQRRWAVNLAGWAPQPEEWEFLLRLLPMADVADVQRFKFAEDQRHALVSRLLQRKCAAEVLGVPFGEVQIKRTKGRKPFVIAAVERPHAPNFNFNVSHEGSYVVLASEGYCLCGIDIAAPQRLRRGPQKPVATYLQSFRRQFTDHEWGVIAAAGASKEAMADAFQRNWSLKEAFIKLRGDGLAFDMAQLEFRFRGGPAATKADAYMDGKRLSRWTSTVQLLGDNHWVSVEFTATLQRPDLADAELEGHLAAEELAFQLLGLSDLIPVQQLVGYSAAGGEVL